MSMAKIYELTLKNAPRTFFIHGFCVCLLVTQILRYFAQGDWAVRNLLILLLGLVLLSAKSDRKRYRRLLGERDAEVEQLRDTVSHT